MNTFLTVWKASGSSTWHGISWELFHLESFEISAVWASFSCRPTNWEHFQKVFFGISVASAISTCRTTVWRNCPAVPSRNHVDLIFLFLLAVDDFPSFALELTTALGEWPKIEKNTAMLLMTERLCQLLGSVSYYSVVFYTSQVVQDFSSTVCSNFIALLSPNALRTLCRSQKAAVPWPEKPKLQLTPCGHVRWTRHFYSASKTIYWWHQHVVSILWPEPILVFVFEKHEFDWASCWSVRWVGIPAQTRLARQQIENTSRRSFSESQKLERTSFARQLLENTSRRSFSESQ